ncbi:MAG: metallophosphoesterase [Nostoc sp. C3-bin3]|nr:metallophosphoesterase [Nostoc sp. C3-bin3]
MQRRIFIGDVHGHYDGLMVLLDAIAPNSHDQVYFLGDLINRGGKSAEVVEFVRQSSYHCLLGNHEQMLWEYLSRKQVLQKALETGRFGNYEETAASYRKVGLSLLPVHLQWFASLPTHLDLRDIFAVHAGVHPQIPLEKQTSREFCWIRQPFHHMSQPYFTDKLIIVGHTVTFKFPGVVPGKIAQGQGWLDIDTGAYDPRSGWLTALDISNHQVYQVNVFSRVQRILSLEEATVKV